MIKRVIKFIFIAILISFCLHMTSKIIIVYNAIQDSIASARGYDINTGTSSANKNSVNSSEYKDYSASSNNSSMKQNSNDIKNGTAINSGNKLSSDMNKNNDAYGKNNDDEYGHSQDKSALDVATSIVQIPIDINEAESKAKSIAGGDVDLRDFFTVGFIVLSKLNADEIKYLFSSAKEDYFLNTPVEEIEKTREILFSKLSEEDLETLRALGKKYGYSMRLLERELDVAKAKEEVMKSYGRQ